MSGPSTFYMPSAVGDRASFDLVMCFDEGVKDGINRVWSMTDGTSLAPNVTLPNIFETLRVVPSGTAQNVYTYASSDYEMSETSGDEQPEYQDVMYEQTISNTRYKKRVLKIDIIDWNDDNIGRYRVKFHAAGTAAIVKPYRWVVNTMRSGYVNNDTTKPVLTSNIDGAAFYGTHYSRPGDSTSTAQPNTFVRPGGLTAPTFAEMWGTMVGWKGEDGQVAGSVPSVLAVGPQDLDAALDLIYMEKPSGLAGGGNRYRGRVEVCFIPEWGESTPGANDGVWALLDTHNSLERAWVFQEREPNRLFPLTTNPTDPIAIRHGYLDWQLQGRWEIGMGHYRRILRVTRK
jgi:phage major head subunit gpT-like protein